MSKGLLRFALGINPFKSLVNDNFHNYRSVSTEMAGRLSGKVAVVTASTDG